MWKFRQFKDFAEHRYSDDFMRIDIRRFKGNEPLTIVYVLDEDSFYLLHRSHCGCFRYVSNAHVKKFTRRRTFKKLPTEEKLALLKRVLSQRLNIADAIIVDCFPSVHCPTCSCNRCENYLEDCTCLCDKNHLMKECDCTCPKCELKLTQCTCWCSWCGHQDFTIEHEMQCEQEQENECFCCPCCGCTCDDYEDDYYDEYEDEGEDNDEKEIPESERQR